MDVDEEIKSRECGEIGSESREKEDLLSCSSPLFKARVGPRSGKEGEQYRPLHRMRQIPFIHHALFLISFYIYSKVF